MTRIKSYKSRFEAESARNLLVAHGIPAFVEADDAGGARPFLLLAIGGARLCVKDEDKERALELLEE